ncbi:hypothetical protein BH11PSE11_BH11PSE11_01840 [soil metagenome]
MKQYSAPSAPSALSAPNIHARMRVIAATLIFLGVAGFAQAQLSYRLEKVVTIASSNTGWDYLSLDEKRGHMFIAHRKDGLHVYDVKSGKFIKTLRGSQDANTSALAPEFDLGLAGTTDGHVVVFRLSNLKTLSRFKSETDGFDGATFDPVSKRFIMVGETDVEKKTTPLLFFDGKSGKPLGSVTVESVKVDAPRADGAGNIFMPLRDQGSVVKVDAKAMQVVTTFALKDCMKPASLEVDSANQRIFVGCRGAGSSEPALAVLEAVSGRQIARLPIGRGVDEVMYDASRKMVVTANGEDANLTVIEQKSADQYRVAETVGTRPMARTGVLAEKTGKIYLVNAQYIYKHSDDKKAEPTFVPNTFSVLTYSR